MDKQFVFTKHIVIYNSCLTSVFQIIDILQVVQTFTTSLPQSYANDELTTHLRLVCVVIQLPTTYHASIRHLFQNTN